MIFLSQPSLHAFIHAAAVGLRTLEALSLSPLRPKEIAGSQGRDKIKAKCKARSVPLEQDKRGREEREEGGRGPALGKRSGGSPWSQSEAGQETGCDLRAFETNPSRTSWWQ